jgi:hypothetical protein
MNLPHSPKLQYLCEDPECCDNGCPVVECRSCGKDRPCPDWQSRHTETQIQAQDRYVARKHWGNDQYMIDYTVKRLSTLRKER